MKKQLLVRAGIILLAVCVTLTLNAFDNHFLKPRQDRRIILNVSVQETELILKALGKLPTEEAGGLYFNVQYQAQTQLSPPAKKDTVLQKPKKQ